MMFAAVSQVSTSLGAFLSPPYQHTEPFVMPSVPQAPRLAKSFEPGGPASPGNAFSSLRYFLFAAKCAGDATVKGHPNPFKASSSTLMSPACCRKVQAEHARDRHA